MCCSVPSEAAPRIAKSQAKYGYAPLGSAPYSYLQQCRLALPLRDRNLLLSRPLSCLASAGIAERYG